MKTGDKIIYLSNHEYYTNLHHSIGTIIGFEGPELALVSFKDIKEPVTVFVSDIEKINNNCLDTVNYRFYIWDNGDSSVGISPMSNKITLSFEVDPFAGLDKEDRYNFENCLKEEIKVALKVCEELFSEVRINILTEEEYDAMQQEQIDFDKSIDDIYKKQ